MWTIQDTQSYEYTLDTTPIPYLAIPDFLREKSSTIPDKEAVICFSSSGQRFSITYSELYTKSELFARGISTLGYERNSIIAIETKNTLEWLICTFGSQMAGLIPLHFGFGKPNGEDVVSILNGVGECVSMIIDPSSVAICKAFCENVEKSSTSVSSKIKTLKNIILMNGDGEEYLDYKKIIKMGLSNQSPLPVISADDICAMFLTSGSTGNAKAVPCTHRKIILNGFHWYHILHLQSGEKFYNYFPFGWLASYPITMLTHEVTHVTLEDLRRVTSVEEINKLTIKCLDVEECVSTVFLAPAICDLIKAENIACRSFPLRVVCTTGLPVDAICSQIIGSKATKFAIVYGSTEIGVACSITVRKPSDYVSYSTGKPVPGAEVKIVSDGQQIVQRGTSGEIYTRTRDRFLGYRNTQEDTENPCDDLGWYRTDDIGYMKADGNVVVTGRKSEVIISSGDLVSPVYLEGILKEHESVLNAYVCPVYNQHTFQETCAAILLRKEKTASQGELREFLTTQSGRYADSFLSNRHVPKIYLFLESFPSTQSGKLDRKSLAKIIKQKLKIQ